MNTVFIVNPAAGHGRAASRWEDAAAAAGRLWPRHGVRFTSGAGNASYLAREAAASGARLIVAVGGDGTLSEAADGLLGAMERDAIELATFPAGSGCDFARHHGISRDPAIWAAAMNLGRVLRLDVAVARLTGEDGIARERRFINIAALGLAGDVALAVSRRGKLFGGPLTYLLEGARAAYNARPRRLQLVVDGIPEPPADFQLVVAGNTSTSGGGMKLTPDADVQDGELELLTVGPLGRRELFSLLPLVYSGGHVGREGVRIRRVRKVEIRSSTPLPINIDGEVESATECSFAVLPRALNFRF